MDLISTERMPETVEGHVSEATGIPMPVDPAQAQAAVRRVREEFIAGSPHLVPGDILGAGQRDLVRLFELYDGRCFGGQLATRLAARGAQTPILSFSKRLTSSGGRTKWVVRTRPDAPPGTPPLVTFRIEVSIPLLVDSFGDGRSAVVCGLPCADRLDALLRIFEHELVHLLLMLTGGDIRCRGPLFHCYASRLFGHTVHNHELITGRDRAREMGLRAGDFVSFEHDGERMVGQIERIRRRATVAVREPEQSRGRKFYVPLPHLARVEGPPAADAPEPPARFVPFAPPPVAPRPPAHSAPTYATTPPRAPYPPRRPPPAVDTLPSLPAHAAPNGPCPCGSGRKFKKCCG